LTDGFSVAAESQGPAKKEKEKKNVRQHTYVGLPGDTSALFMYLLGYCIYIS